ncbi:type I inositol polyphosphate 5-phosphatase 10 isoform X2 [Physcomitrium patens]|uniref:Inositol polyphosphate-related phosphatase domain-containing protein n=2 Tax=Physcomitrium patens TaxID=3218 RepID=A0A7I4CFJ9_PHYPA|nr:type I inositol polyphosphate 5-phosphatase 10-like isoform X2 [Physcomitrium patens]|eukprot:XP_024360750.1 type I inositol polyphosphate 5-phosphatase 10-like isoform X2 [Physcomitrella patens]
MISNEAQSHCFVLLICRSIYKLQRRIQTTNPMQDRQPEFWPRQLLKKWISFRETGDDFERDCETDADEFSESEEFEDTDGVGESGDEDTRRLLDSDFETDSAQHADVSNKNPLPRVQSETLREQFVVNNEYKIAVGTWNVGGLLPPEDINLDGFLDSSDPADIYVLGFQEIVPLNSNNVLCVEDDHPTVVWDGLIRQALNNGVKCCERPHRSCSAPTSPRWNVKEDISDVPEVSDVNGLLNTAVAEATLESTLLFQKFPNPSDNHWPLERTALKNVDQSLKRVTKNVKSSEAWLYEATVSDDVTRGSLLVNSSPTPTKHSCNRYVRIASKQMVGIFISVWVRTELRRYVNNVKVCVVGCGILNFLRNKGAVSVSMCLHQTSFCFVCTHLTSGHKEGDELRRNADVADVLRRTTFPRLVKLSGVKLPETIMGHDRIIWLGDLNYRIDLPDLETWILVNQSDWKSLLPKDQLKVERDAGRVFQGWHEDAISFPPTYKFVVESDEYFGEDTFKGDKRRTPAWCDRILSHGQGLAQLSYLMVDAKLSDHRPVIAKFMAEVEAVSGRKLREVCRHSNDAKVNVEELLPRILPVSRFHSLHNHEHIEHSRINSSQTSIIGANIC